MSGLAALAGLDKKASLEPATDPSEPLDLTAAPFPNLSTAVIRDDDKKLIQLERGRRR